MGLLKLVVSRAAELVEGAVAATTRTSEAAIVREAARVLRSRAILFGSGVWFPPGVVVHLSGIDHERLCPMFNTARATVGAKVAARLRTPDGGVPEVRVIFDVDPQLPSGFAVSALDRTDAPALLTLVRGPQQAQGDATGYPCLVWPDGRRLAVDPSGIDIGREVVGPGRVNDPSVSARHAVVALASAGVRVTDVGSTNGTWVNGTRTSHGLLHHGDIVRVGSSTLRLDWPAAQATAVLRDEGDNQKAVESVQGREVTA